MPPQSRAAEPDNLPKGSDVRVCGIVGYVGHDAALPYLLSGLETLEYRGYDSAGIALVNGEGVTVKKAAGHLSTLKTHVNGMNGGQSCGIGHTRWATHGAPTDENAHPHTDCRGRIAAVHNGIIENYRELRDELKQQGHRFQSETDTEVIPHLLEAYDHGDLVAAARSAAGRLEGAYAFLAVSADDPETLVAVREASPLVIGLGAGVNYVASDFTALLPYTRQVLVLDNGELAVVTPAGVALEDLAGHSLQRDPMTVTWTAEQASRGGYPHFMIKEIREQPDVWADCLRGRISPEGTVVLQELGLTAEDLDGIRRIHIVAAGTAYHAGLVGAQLLERLARIPVTVDVASEFRYRDPILDKGTVVWAISQSGETADTLASVRLAKSRGCPVWAITNVVGSTLSREADRVAYNRAGPEVAVASTKAYTTQLLILSLLTAALASHRGYFYQDLTPQLQMLPAAGSRWLDQTPDLNPVAQRLVNVPSLFYVGRGFDFALALEGQLKLKEITYIHAEAYAAGELKHGTLALIEKGVPVVAVVSQPDLLPKVRSNLMEVRARGAYVIGVVADAMVGELEDLLDQVVAVPTLSPWVMPALMALPLQLLAYDTAVARGVDVDKPRNLAKSVTVE